jgi:hypothetical protein
MDWSFQDPPNVAVFTSKDIVEKGKWIYYVSHDGDDGAWQFHSIDGPPSSGSDARLVSLKSIVELDPTIAVLADLPLGWCAWRDTQNSVWQRQLKR